MVLYVRLIEEDSQLVEWLNFGHSTDDGVQQLGHSAFDHFYPVDVGQHPGQLYYHSDEVLHG